MDILECEFKPVESKEAITKVVFLAKKIWNEHYLSIIGQGQIDYMLTKFQSESAITRQIKEEYYEYYLVYENTNLVGYLSYRVTNQELFLSKIYLLANQRGKGIGKKMLDFITSNAKQSSCKKIRLTVNKYNHESISAYKKLGFVEVDSIVFDIGGGYVMDDFVLEKSLVTK